MTRLPAPSPAHVPQPVTINLADYEVRRSGAQVTLRCRPCAERLLTTRLNATDLASMNRTAELHHAVRHARQDGAR